MLERFTTLIYTCIRERLISVGNSLNMSESSSRESLDLRFIQKGLTVQGHLVVLLTEEEVGNRIILELER